MIMRYNEEYNCFVGFVILSKKKKNYIHFWMRNFSENIIFFFSCRFERVSTWFGSLVMEV